MDLIGTIFALVFLTELISWIGKSVLQDFVRVSRFDSYRVACTEMLSLFVN